MDRSHPIVVIELHRKLIEDRPDLRDARRGWDERLLTESLLVLETEERFGDLVDRRAGCYDALEDQLVDVTEELSDFFAACGWRWHWPSGMQTPRQASGMDREPLQEVIPRNILVPTDFSTHAEHALDYACEFAAKLDATIHLINAVGAVVPELTVTLSGTMFETLRRNNLLALENLVEARRGVATFGRLIVTDGEARDGILAAANEVAADLIVMGTHGRRGIVRAVRGSVAEDIMRRASCPVLTVRVTSRHHAPVKHAAG